MRDCLSLPQFILVCLVSVLTTAGTVYPTMTGYTRVLHNSSSWGACGVDPGSPAVLRPEDPLSGSNFDRSEQSLAYAGFRSRLRRGADPFPCHRALDTRGDAAFSIQWGVSPGGIFWEPGRVTQSNFRSAIFEITSFRSRSGDGVRSGPGQCDPGAVCPRPQLPSSCRFQLFAQTGHVPGYGTVPATRRANWEGPVSNVASLVQTGGRGFMLVSGTSNVNGGAWVVTDIVRRWMSENQYRDFILTIADSEPSLQPAHRMKTIDCDGYFTARLRIDYN